MPSKFGGVPVEDQPQQSGSKFGGIPVEEPPAGPAAAPPSHPISDFVGNFADAVNPLPGIKSLLTTNPIESAANIIHGQVDQFRQARHALTNNIEMPALSDRLMTAGGHALAGMIPLVGPAAAQAGEQIGSGDVAGGLGRGAGMLASMAAPSAVKGLGAAVKAPAGPIAESALGITKANRTFGKTPGAAILNDTKGFEPSTIAASAKDTMGRLAPERDALVSASKTPVSTQPGLDVINNAENKFVTHNNKAAVNQLSPMRAHLTQDAFTGAAIPRQISPMELQRLKQGFSEQFFHPNPDTLEPVSAAGNEAYGALNNELERGAPGAKAINRRISSLSDVADRAESTGRGATATQRVLGRVAKPTGALVGAATGMMSGHPASGLALGLGLPEIVSSPVTQMLVARGLHGAGTGLQTAAPVLGNAARGGVLVRRREQDQR